MSPLSESFSEVLYDRHAVEHFPWPVVASYDNVHRLMKAGLAVNAAWQVRDLWENLIKFVGVLAASDQLEAASSNGGNAEILSILLKPQGLSLDDWTRVIELSWKARQPKHEPLAALRELLFPPQHPRLLPLMVGGDATQSFIAWRNRRFAHGVFAKDEATFAREARLWLDRLHEAYDLCRDFFAGTLLSSEFQAGAFNTWGARDPLATHQKHAHEFDKEIPAPVIAHWHSASDSLQLWPLLSVQSCSICGAWKAFFLDRFDSRRSAWWFLDFLEGHSQGRRVPQLGAWKLSSDAANEALRDGISIPAEPFEPNPERFRNFNGEFEPLTYVAKQVAAFIRGHDRGALLMFGTGGAGKSWCCQGLERSDMLPAALGRVVPVLYADLGSGPDVKPAGVIKQLADRSRDRNWVAAPHAEGLEPWASAVMRSNALGELVIAVDGWDELPADSEVPSLLGDLSSLPRGCYLLLAGRPDMKRAASEKLQGIREHRTLSGALSIGPSTPAHRDALRRYAEKRLAQHRPEGLPPLPVSWAGPIIAQANDSFLHTFHYCRALRFGVFEDVRELPKPEQYYPAFFRQLSSRVGVELFETHYARALSLIAVFEEDSWSPGITLSDLASLGLERGKLIVILADLADLLSTHRSSYEPDTIFRLGHATIADFLQTDPEWMARLKSARKFLVEHTVNRFSHDWMSVDLDDRLERVLFVELPFNLVRAGLPKTYVNEVCNDPLLAAAFLRLGDTDAIWQMRLHPWAATLVERAFRAELRSSPQKFEQRHPLIARLSKGDLTSLTKDQIVHFATFTLKSEPNQRELRQLIAMHCMVFAKKADDAGNRQRALRLYDAALDVAHKAAIRDTSVPEPAGERCLPIPWYFRIPIIGPLILRRRATQYVKSVDRWMQLPIRPDGRKWGLGIIPHLRNARHALLQSHGQYQDIESRSESEIADSQQMLSNLEQSAGDPGERTSLLAGLNFSFKWLSEALLETGTGQEYFEPLVKAHEATVSMLQIQQDQQIKQMVAFARLSLGKLHRKTDPSASLDHVLSALRLFQEVKEGRLDAGLLQASWLGIRLGLELNNVVAATYCARAALGARPDIWVNGRPTFVELTSKLENANPKEARTILEALDRMSTEDELLALS